MELSEIVHHEDGNFYLRLPQPIARRLTNDHRCLWFGDGPDYLVAFRQTGTRVYYITKDTVIEI